ncbi:MAG TPA: murein biosynthesis integral membrane protein MurJ [Gemmatimonadaceae bacterium]|nr:murein biosynthesis integral membrane protein MurJ [Gemmatimonadaceae bacterium]
MTTPAEPALPKRQRAPLGGAAVVGLSILASRVLGIVRETLRAHYLGATIGIVGDAWTMAIRIPNLLQNLLGEGVLSASFIPVYARLLAEGDEEEAGRLAGTMAALLAATMVVLVALGVIFAPEIVHLIASTFTGEKFELTVTLTRILFPGAALFVMGAWCIGVLTSHRRMAMAYLAPVFWNLAMIAAFLWFGRKLDVISLAKTVAWASVAGAALQVGFQLPAVLKSAKRLKLSLDHRRESVRRVLRNFGPVALSRGAVQISQFIDLWIANLLPQGAPALLMTAQTVSMLPISLFGMAVSAAELPEMSSVLGSPEERLAKLRQRIVAGARRIAFFVIPSAIAFVAFGDVIIRVLFEGGRFKPIDTVFTWAILAGSAFGLLATTLARLYSSAYYAMHDTKRPFRIALIRISLSIVLGYLAARPLTNALGIDRLWGTAALTVAAGVAGWVEFALLRRGLRATMGDVSVPGGYAIRLWALGVGAALVALGVQMLTDRWVDLSHPRLDSLVVAIAVLGAFGVIYLAGATILRIPESDAITRRLLRR